MALIKGRVISISPEGDITLDESTEGHIVLKSDGKFIDSSIIEEADRIFCSKTFTSESGSFSIGPAITLSELSGYLQSYVATTSRYFISLDYLLDPINGTQKPTYDARDPLVIRSVTQSDDSVLMNNVVSYSINATTDRDVIAVYLKLNDSVTNARGLIRSQVTGLPIKYFPNEKAYLDGNGGVDLASGEVRLELQTPLAEIAIMPITVEMVADQSINLLGDGVNPWRAIDSRLISYHTIAMEEDIITVDERAKLLGIEEGAEVNQTDVEIKTQYENNANTNVFTDAEKEKLGSLTGARFLGIYTDLTALQTAHPTADEGSTATVTSPDGNMFFWNGSAWTDSGTGFVGDMLKAIFDPTNKNADAFNMDNMSETSTKKILTAIEREKLGGIEELAEVNNISDTDATDLTDGGDTTIHKHDEDRKRINHTGTQLASTISDFDIEVSNNPDVSVNTEKISFPEAPIDGNRYAREGSAWSEILIDDLLNGYLNGMSIERQELSLVVEGTSVFLDVQAIGGGDITYFMNNQKYILDCTTGLGVGGKARVEVPQGTASNPLRSIVYAFYDDTLSKLNLAVTYASVPSEEYIPVAIITIQTYNEVSSNGALLLQRTTEAITHNGKSAISWEREKIRSLGARYWGGIDQDLIITTNQTSEDDISFTTTSGSVFQLHRQSFPEYDISTDGLWVANASGSSNLSRYQKITNLNEIKEDADGNEISDGSCINLVVWGSINYNEGTSKMFVNLPKSLYTNEDEAKADINNTSITTIPNEFSTTGFLVAKVVLKYNSDNNGTWTNLLSETTEVWNTGYQTIQTPNYPNEYDAGFDDYIGTITHLGASKIRVKFDDFNTETNYDFIRLRDGVSDANIYNYSGIYQSFVSGEIDGDTVRVRFKSDSSVTKKGVSITSYEYLTNGVSGNKVIDLRGVQSGVNVSSNSSGIVDAPNDGNSYVRKNREWALMVKDGFTLHFDANDARYKTNNATTSSSRNGHPIVKFRDNNEDVVTFGDTIPNSYNGENVTVDIDWVAESATSGAVSWIVSFERNTPGGNDIDSDSYAPTKVGTSTTSGINGVITRTTITFTQSQADGITANDHFRLKLLRDPEYVGDTMSDNAQLLKVSVRCNCS